MEWFIFHINRGENYLGFGERDIFISKVVNLPFLHFCHLQKARKKKWMNREAGEVKEGTQLTVPDSCIARPSWKPEQCFGKRSATVHFWALGNVLNIFSLLGFSRNATTKLGFKNKRDPCLVSSSKGCVLFTAWPTVPQLFSVSSNNVSSVQDHLWGDWPSSTNCYWLLLGSFLGLCLVVKLKLLVFWNVLLFG